MIELNLTKNENDAIQGVKGKYYARVEYKDTINAGQLAKHMSEHTTSFSRGEILGMLTDMVGCIKELALQGYVIKIDDLGLFKASVEANGLTLKKGAKISAGIGAQRKDEELTANVSLQQFAASAVKIIMQASGDTSKDEMTRAASTRFTSKAKELVKSLTGNDSTDNGGDNGGTTNNSGTDNGGSGSGSGSNGGGTGSITPSGGDNGGGDNGGGDNGGGDNGPSGFEEG